jgi:TRAP-type C4-dicarboxylate transport system permease small subunit
MMVSPQAIGRLDRFERNLTRILEGTATACFFVLAVLVVLLVVLRYVFNTTIIGGNEVTGYLFIYTTALGAAVSVGSNQHIRIGFFVDSLPRRVGMLFDALAVALVMALHCGILWLSIEWISAVGGFDFPVINIPQGVVQVAIPIGCVFVIFYCLVRLARMAWSSWKLNGKPR